MNKRFITFCLVFFAVSHLSFAQSFHSVDASTNIKSISVHNPNQAKLWGKTDEYKIVEITEICDYSSVGGSPESYRKHAALFTKGQYDKILHSAQDGLEVFIPKIPAVSFPFLPIWEKESDLRQEIETALFSHNQVLKKYPYTNVYEFCESGECPVYTSHEILESFQISKHKGGYYLILGMPLNNNGKPIKWNTSNINTAVTGAETIIDISEAQFYELFK